MEIKFKDVFNWYFLVILGFSALSIIIANVSNERFGELYIMLVLLTISSIFMPLNNIILFIIGKLKMKRKTKKILSIILEDRFLFVLGLSIISSALIIMGIESLSNIILIIFLISIVYAFAPFLGLILFFIGSVLHLVKYKSVTSLLNSILSFLTDLTSYLYFMGSLIYIITLAIISRWEGLTIVLHLIGISLLSLTRFVWRGRK